jgi:hypothetical protein
MYKLIVARRPLGAMSFAFDECEVSMHETRASAEAAAAAYSASSHPNYRVLEPTIYNLAALMSGGRADAP